MKKPLLCFLLVLALSHAVAQKINFDSLVKVAISLNRNDKVISPNNPDSLLRTLFVNKSPAARIRTVYDIILLDNGELDPEHALYYHHKILDLAKKNHDSVVEAVIMAELGYTLYKDGDAPEGLKLMFDALKLANKTGNKQAIGTVYENLGLCSDNLQAAIGYYKNAFQYSKAGGDDMFAAAELNNLSTAYQKKNDIDSARYFLMRSFNFAIHTHIHFVVVICVSNLGQLETENKLKLKYFRDALMMSRLPSEIPVIGGVLLRMAHVYQQEHQTDSALIYAKKAYGLLNGKLLARMLAPTRLLAQLYKGKNADSALKYTTAYFTIKDSLYNINKMQRAQSRAFAEQQRQQELVAQKTAYQTALRLYLMAAIVVFLLLLAIVFWRNNRQNKKANFTLRSQKTQIQNTLSELKQTQTQLIQSEKMASLGELTAGIAHEIQNPLNFVNNFSEVSVELLEELKAESKKPKAGRDEELEGELIDNVAANLEKIRHHGQRADAIVKGMLQHSRTSSGQKEPTNLNILADEYLRLAYHGLRAKDKDFNAELITRFDEKLPEINVFPQDIGRVLLNLFNNAFYAVNQKKKSADADYKPEVTVSTSAVGGYLVIVVKDNGNGIPDAIKDKIMQPFFTTKPTGDGTGLGLSLSYDIVVKGHGGQLQVVTKEGVYTEFIVTLPIS